MAKHRPTHAVQNVDSGPLPRSLTAVALAASALLAGCGPADTGTITDAEGEPIAESQAPLLVDCSTITPDNSWAEVKGLAKVLAAVVKAYKNKDAEGAIGVAEAIMGFGDVSVDARIEALNAQLKGGMRTRSTSRSAVLRGSRAIYRVTAQSPRELTTATRMETSGTAP
jgi:hypothetical protein